MIARLPPSLAVALLALGAAPAHAAGGQLLLRLDHDATVRAAPSASARVLGAVERKAPLTGATLVLPVVQQSVGRQGVRWVRVRLPKRPNESTGWVKAAAGRITATPWRIVVRRQERRALVFDGNRLRASFPVVVGKPSTPTPLGSFFVTEKLHLGTGVEEGPWALATSAYSDVLTDFAGGPGQVGLHGDVGFSAPMGSFASHGCIRFANAAITWIAGHVGAGTPVTIER